ncbi:MAG: diacylglycerol/lipid kinase family protein, partial [Anaerolineae bacterium]
MTYQIILNPFANRWIAGARQGEIEAAFQAAGAAYQLMVTNQPGEATAVAREAAESGCTAVVAAGGDGTISEVVNGLIQAAGEGPTAPLGIIPVGSANDFSLMMGIPGEVETAVQTILKGNSRPIDAGQIRYGEQVHYFNNNSAAAMEPMVTLEHIKIQRIKGEMRYYVALVKALFKLKAWHMRITWDDGVFEGPVFLLSVCNGPRTGGFMMAPGAEVGDGRLDFVLVPEVSKGTLLKLLVKLMGGTHVEHPAVTFARTSKLTITSQPGTPLHADGEILGETET